jgi:hypothetical protein
MPRKKASAMFSTNTALVSEAQVVFHCLLLLDLVGLPGAKAQMMDPDEEEGARREQHEAVGVYQPPSLTA